MKKKTISFSLDPGSIDAAIKELHAYRDHIRDKLPELRRRVAETIKWTAEEGFSSALTSDILPKGGSPEPSTVTVTMDPRDNVSVVIAHGAQAVFIEFGAGVYHNGSVGTSPHPYVNGEGNIGSPEVSGFTIGSYGPHGKQDTWALPKELWTETDENGKLLAKLTHGTPAQMPMYHGVQYAMLTMSELIREVFEG